MCLALQQVSSASRRGLELPALPDEMKRQPCGRLQPCLAQRMTATPGAQVSPQYQAGDKIAAGISELPAEDSCRADGHAADWAQASNRRVVPQQHCHNGCHTPCRGMELYARVWVRATAVMYLLRVWAAGLRSHHVNSRLQLGY